MIRLQTSPLGDPILSITGPDCRHKSEIEQQLEAEDRGFA